jgi:uncharacterized protein (DUF302 family)
MVASPSVAIDLPLKILVWEDADGLPEELVQRIAVIEALASNAAG